MRAKGFRWLGRDFVALSYEARNGDDPVAQARDVYARFAEELGRFGLSLDDTVRTRLWARDRPARDAASRERLTYLGGRARSASSSYIAPDRFASDARVAMDLLALRPSGPGREKTIREYDPPGVPVRYVALDSLVFLSGVTTVLPTLAEQIDVIVRRILDSLADAGSDWDRVERVSCYLHRSQQPAEAESLLREALRAILPGLEYAFVDGYSAEGKLLEVEVTARL